jgi:mannose-6-phosphate isomerase
MAASDHMTEQPSAEPVERVDKPWGHEKIFAIVEDSYVGKTLPVADGESLSLVISGKHSAQSARTAATYGAPGRRRSTQPGGGFRPGNRR